MATEIRFNTCLTSGHTPEMEAQIKQRGSDMPKRSKTPVSNPPRNKRKLLPIKFIEAMARRVREGQSLTDMQRAILRNANLTDAQRVILEDTGLGESKPISPTHKTYNGLDAAYAYFNEALFDNELPRCLLTLTRRRRSHGYFSAGRFRSSDGNEVTDEIALNPQRFNGCPTEEILATLVHEMCHQWQEHCGTPPKNLRYHDTEWADKMESIGLMPSDTGKPGGKRTGAKVSDYIIDGGPFAKACAAGKFDRSKLFYDIAQEQDAKARRNKAKYTCPDCKLNAWAQPYVNLKCGDCDIPMRETSQGSAN